MTQITAKPQGVWAWILQRVTAVLLIVFLGTHLLVLHYVPENMNINFLGVAARFKSVLYVIIDSGLLAVALYHALNGVRNILFDFVVDEGKRRTFNILFWLVGLAFLLWGAYALMFFVK
jgi:succinate dehydrogenase / fumarate reductase, membrane anchor subunit